MKEGKTMIRLNDRDSATLATIAQYQKLPTQKRRALVGRLSEQAKPIGRILIGDDPENPSEEVIKVAKQFRDWTVRNRKSRNSARATRAISSADVLVDSR
jgi:hypothetical protein